MPYKLLLICLFSSANFIISCTSNQPKINGISFVASPKKVLQENIKPVLNLNANHASVMPFGFVRNVNHPQVIYNTNKQWFGETKEGARQYIEMLQKNRIKVMIKPQIWIWQGEFTGYLKMNSEEDWLVLEKSYQTFILDFAELAEESNVELFCIGTELEQFIVNRPDFWFQLISDIKKIYKGKLTYAANWDEYKRVPFWKELDYIGVDAYFPISDEETPTVQEAKIGWEPWKEEMISVSNKVNKKVIFTEFGYRSIDFSGRKPWDSDYTITSINLKAQTNLTKALFEEIWEEEWFAGGYLWKWFVSHKEVGGRNDNMYTPQNKPVEEIIREYYKIN